MKIGNHEVHPLCELFPWMDDKTFDVLKEDMKSHGQRDTIKLFKDHILDGKNRYRASLELNLTPRIEVLSDDTDITAYVKAVGLCRRDLTPDQRIDIAEEILGYKREMNGSKEKIEKLKKDPKQRELIEHNEIKEIVKEANTNASTVKQYRELKKNPEAKDELKKIKEGKQSIKKAYNKLKPKPAKPKKVKPKKTKEDVEKENVELKHEVVSLENRFKRVIEVLKEHEVWELVKKDLYPIIEKVPSLEPSVKELRKAELI